MSTHNIDPRAIIDSSVRLGDDVTIGPYAVIEKEVEIGEGSWIGSHTIITGPTRIGKHNKIFPFSSIGGDPQDLKYQGGRTWLEIGHHNTIREYCTINRGTELGGAVTRIGNHNLLMAYVHIAHDCQLKNHSILANHVSLAGHVEIHDHATLGGFAGVHQFCKIGAYSFAAAGSMIAKDVPPFVKVSGYYAKPFGLNTVLLQRHEFPEETIVYLKEAYKIIYHKNLTVEMAVRELEELALKSPQVAYFITALRDSERGIVR